MQNSPSHYYYQNVSNFLQAKSFAFISEDLNLKLHLYTKSWVKFINMQREIISILQKLSIFLMTVQFNTKITKISWISATIIYSDFDLEPECNFFASSHRKSAVNRIGGIIRWLTGRASFQRPYNQILSMWSALTSFQWSYCAITTNL